MSSGFEHDMIFLMENAFKNIIFVLNFSDILKVKNINRKLCSVGS